MVIINPVYAPDPDIDVTELPTQLSEHLGITVFTAEVLLSAIVILMFMLPLLFLRASGIYVLIITFCVMGLLVSMSWLPVWLMIIISLITALLYSNKFTKLL